MPVRWVHADMGYAGMMVMDTSVCVTRDTQVKTVLMVTIIIIVTNVIICYTIGTC